MEPSSPNNPKPHKLFATLTTDVREVADELRRRGLGRSLTAALAEAESFYLDEDARRRLAGMGRVSGWIRRVLWLVRGLLLKLTPVRRVLLAIAILLLVTSVRFALRDQPTLSVGFHVPSIGALLVFIVLMLELKDKLVARNELVAGRAVQLALLPPDAPNIPGWDVWLYTQPANDVGGDLVDHLPMGDGRHAVCLGDVAGKALPAALLMVKLQATLRALAPDCATLGALGARTNQILFRDGLPNRFATLAYFVLDSESGHVRYLNAGHIPPLVLRGAAIEALPHASMALGMIETATFEEASVELTRGDILIAVSDGVIEAGNAADEFFGDERLLLAITNSVDRSARGLGSSILQALEAFIGETRPYDDVSVVVMRRTASVL